MKMAIAFTLLILLLSQVIISCKPRARNDRLRIDKELSLQRAADEYLRGVLQVGESSTNLIDRFGPPSFSSTTPTKETCYTFYLPDESNAVAIAGISGFDAFFVSNRLTRWFPIYQR
jgi:hypothetical protein